MTDSSADTADRAVTRRGLFGAGLGRALEAARPGPLPGAARQAAPRTDGDDANLRAASWGEKDETRLGALVRPAAQALLAACPATPGGRLLDLSAGDGALTTLAARTGWQVVAVESDPDLLERGRDRSARAGLSVEWRLGSALRPQAEAGSFDAVVSNFGASHHEDQRAVVAAVVAAARPGATLALTAWTGLMAEVMTVIRPRRRGRSERWSRYETARLHFADYPGLDVLEHSLEWRFDDADAAIDVLAGPGADAAARDRLRAALPALTERHGSQNGDRVELTSDYVMVVAVKP